MEFKTITLPKKLFVGLSKEMSFANNQIPELWRSFMPRKKEITNAIGIELYSAEIYPSGFFKAFNPTTPFIKWAAVEVDNFDSIPEGMHTLVSPEGQYAVFNYKGTSAAAPAFFNNIFTEWLPQAGLSVDDRPHFAVMGAKYKNNDPESEEEIWIPVLSATPH